MWSRGPTREPSYWLTRFLFLRLLGLVYVVAFLCALNQGRALIGEHGLLPMQDYLRTLAGLHPSWLGAFFEAPSLFWLDASDRAFEAVSATGLALALALLAGCANVPLLLALWLLYLSIVNAGQIFYGYGWEILLLEANVLALFLVPPLRAGPFPARTPTPVPVVWLMRWLVFRLMFGAGLIKLRGDSCWGDLTCMLYHYERQPLPNPLSLYFHQLPAWFHALEVLFNHVVELIVPWVIFGPRPLRHAGGALLVLLQALLIVSGNFSFLNWLSVALCVFCFDDSLLGRLVPARGRERLVALGQPEMSKARALAVYAVVAVVALLSLNPVGNMLSPGQLMNASFEPFHLVNTYGAFGSMLRVRDEIVLQGTDDAPGPGARWVDYEFKCKPGDVSRRPCIVAPYQYRIDWQMWFAAMGDYRPPWLIRLVAKLLEGDRAARDLLANGPFESRPPRHIRALLFRYEFAGLGERPWWRRTLLREYLPPLGRSDPELRALLLESGFAPDR